MVEIRRPVIIIVITGATIPAFSGAAKIITARSRAIMAIMVTLNISSAFDFFCKRKSDCT